MPRLPSWAEPAFPLIKKGHLAATRTVGAGARSLSPAGSDLSVPRRGTTSSAETARLDPANAKFHPIETRPQAPWIHPGGEASWFFDDVCTLEHSPSFVLELDRGIATGLAVANLTNDGVLDFETSRYFGARTWREHPLYLQPRLPPIEDISGTLATLATRGTTGNYYHFLFDALPRWKTLVDATDTKPDALLISAQTRYERRLLELTGLDRLPIIEPRADRSFRAETLLVPSTPTYEDLVPTWAIEWLREALPARKTTTGLPRRLYVSRGTRMNSRRVVQEPELIELLRPLGFEVIDPGDYDVQEQIDFFSAAEVVVGAHGAGMSNLVFSPPGVRVLELFAPRYLNPGYWSILASIPDAQYRYLVGRGRRPTPDRKRLLSVYADIDISVDQVIATIEGMLS